MDSNTSKMENVPDITIEDETILNNRDLSFISWMEEEKNSVWRITKRNLENIEQSHVSLLKTIAERGSSFKQCIRENEAVTCNDKDNLQSRCTISDISNKISRINEISAEIQDYENKIRDMKDEIALSKTKDTKDDSELKLKIAAHKKAIQCFKTFCNIKVSLGASTENKIVFHIVFEGFKQHPLTLVFNQDYHVLFFEIKSCSNMEEYQTLMEWFKNEQPDPVCLLIKLRKYITSLK